MPSEARRTCAEGPHVALCVRALRACVCVCAVSRDIDGNSSVISRDIEK